MIYLIGSLRNTNVPVVANQMREAGLEVFDDWYAAGPEADDKWRDYETGRGHSYLEGLQGHAARNVFEFDRKHLDRSDSVLLVLPAGKSGHLELGYALGRGKRGYILLNDPDRWDVMYQFATRVSDNLGEIIKYEQSFTSGTAAPGQACPVDPALAQALEWTRSQLQPKVGPALPLTGRAGFDVVKGPEHSHWCGYCGQSFSSCLCGF